MMGGYGSTRWAWHTKKTTVEECWELSTRELRQDGLLESDIWHSGTWVWQNVRTGEQVASIGYELDTHEQPPWLRLIYTNTDWQGHKSDYNYKIHLQTTRPHFGGLRWWFTCPLMVSGRACNRRVAKLYLPPGGHYYGCRHCYDLTYKSSQESDKRISALRRLGPMGILNGIKNGDVDSLMGLKALPDWVWTR